MSSRGLRNNNPGNIRSGGAPFAGEVRPSTDNAFRQFTAPEWGYRAMFVVLAGYRNIHGLRTLEQFIARWAPAAENNTGAYLRTVSRRSGVAPEAVVDIADSAEMQAIVAAMSFVENGVPAVEADVRRGWELYVRG